MVSLTTPAAQHPLLATPFDLPGIAGRRHTLESVRGANGTVVMFICNHCPYVKAVAAKIVRDMTELAQQGIGSQRPLKAEAGVGSGLRVILKPRDLMLKRYIPKRRPRQGHRRRQ